MSGEYVDSWCAKHKVTEEERTSPVLSHMFDAMAACERKQDIKIASWSQKAEIELMRIRRECRSKGVRR